MCYKLFIYNVMRSYLSIVCVNISDDHSKNIRRNIVNSNPTERLRSSSFTRWNIPRRGSRRKFKQRFEIITTVTKEELEENIYYYFENVSFNWLKLVFR